MSKGVIGLIVGVVAVLVVVGSLVSAYFSAWTLANELENALGTTYDNNRNILAQYGQKVKEAAQVPSMQAEDLQKVFSGALGARYGSDGSKATMQWIKEQNPNLDQRTYIQLQRIIEAGRNEFQANQTKMLDKKRVYTTHLGSPWTGFWMKVAGYPKINLKDIVIVSTERADDAFRTKREEELKIR
jgi:hypothetical protein